MGPTTRGILGITVLLWAVGACAAPTPGPKIAPAPRQPEVPVASATAGNTSSAEDAPGAEDLGVAVGDLHQVDWDGAPLPPGFCGIPTPTRLSGGMARTTSGTWGPVTVAALEVAHGDLLGDDADEAALALYCDNGGGTGAGTLEYGMVVYGSRAGELVSLGILTPQVQDAGQRPTSLSVAEWRQHALVVTEYYYRDPDPTCCPSGIAETTWTWTSEEQPPSPGAPHVLQ